MEHSITIVIMSGYADGKQYEFHTASNGQVSNQTWQLRIGRNEDNDLSLNKDAFVSRNHAKLHYIQGAWSLEDCKSTNGTFIEDAEDINKDQRVTDTVALTLNQLFRVGRTWMRIQPIS